ncbi:hypothetical protein N7449_005821 [Penicillium cf. viridicatum]|uniref:WW domain-containing oxidoreductase n=1 Tax=Penicillium cf. viridicatum TaxID=2972119 RepID=A0A9W9SW77_9EURO|nr:hypothetical protein N7449_005821 [Penicillium cf. viridicatum]
MSRYTGAHAKPNGPGKLKGEVIVITGTSSGIGIETTRALATTGATLFLTARDVAKAESALASIFEPSRMEIIEMDQASLSSVYAAAAAILAKTSKIHLLVKNAGIMAIPDLRLTADGHELQFGTNHLSHFLFYNLLEPALLAATTPDHPSRVVTLASSAHNVHGINDPDNYDFQKGGYDPSRRYGSRHLHATSVHPGLVQTGLTQHMPPDAFKGMEYLYPTMKSVEQGAATSVWAAIGKAWKHDGGKYLVNCAMAEPYAEGDDKFSATGYSSYAYDEEKAKRLWSDSLKLVGLRSED